MTATEDETGAQGSGAQPQQQAEPSPDAFGSPSAPLPPAAAAVVRRRRVQTRQKRITLWGVLFTLLCVGLLGGLAWVGYQASLKVGGGTQARETDPTQPGYVAEPRLTETDLFVLTDSAGAFASALVLVPDQSGLGGTAVPISPSFVVPEFEGAPPMFLGDVFAEGGIEGLQERLGIALTFRINSAEVVPAEAVAQLANGEPIEVDNVDDLVERLEDGTQEVRWRAGPVSLQPEEIAGFMAFEGTDDPAPNQALRTQAVWEALLARASTIEQPELPAGERALDSDGPGFSEALWTLMAGEVRFDTVPMARVPVPDSLLVAWMPDETTIDNFVARVVPLPSSPAPGVREPVAVLNGTTDPDATAAAVPVVVKSGGWVSLVGNADSFEEPATTVQYAGPAAADTADLLAAELGVTATETTSEIESAVVLVTLGGGGA